MTPVYFFDFRRLMHFSSGGYMGTPITRYYWNEFLEGKKACIQGHVLEIGTTTAVKRYGGSAVTKADAIDIVPGPEVTITSDLSKAWEVPADQFDAFMNQFTMHGLRDDMSALYHSIRIMKPGGTLLCNFPAAGLYPYQGASLGGKERFLVYKWYTPAGVREMMAELSISPADYEERIYGSLKGFLRFLLRSHGENMTHISRC
jgi:SAM-dependent methyltransferase